MTQWNTPQFHVADECRSAAVNTSPDELNDLKQPRQTDKTHNYSARPSARRQKARCQIFEFFSPPRKGAETAAL